MRGNYDVNAPSLPLLPSPLRRLFRVPPGLCPPNRGRPFTLFIPMVHRLMGRVSSKPFLVLGVKAIQNGVDVEIVMDFRLGRGYKAYLAYQGAQMAAALNTLTFSQLWSFGRALWLRR